jgi:acetylornithine deacetylase/succinyl-diaminopimelate desuccinylase-like protein
MLAAAPALALTPGAQPPPKYKVMAREILAQLVGIDSTHAHGSLGAARAIEARVLAAGFARQDVQVLAPPDHPTKGNVVIRLHGRGLAKPLLFIGHLDVVEVDPKAWHTDPFKLVEKDGYFYGRGTEDMKGEDAVLLTALIRLKLEGFVPDRDIIVAFTADEEAGGDADGVEWLFAHHRDLVDSAMVLNVDDSGGRIRDGNSTPPMSFPPPTAAATAPSQGRTMRSTSSRPPCRNWRRSSSQPAPRPLRAPISRPCRNCGRGRSGQT